MGAVGYAKYKNGLAAVMMSTGCGSTNSITGLLDAWQDNLPCIFISGQVKRKETSRNIRPKTHLRNFGVQEADIISIVENITKYSKMINEPNDIYKELEKAYHIAVSGCPGPASPYTRRAISRLRKVAIRPTTGHASVAQYNIW